MRGFAGALGSRLGYNGLPSVFSGLDESDSGNRKKYPFELEKAIHNVMFIQHHIQRQDQFNAVSNKIGPIQQEPCYTATSLVKCMQNIDVCRYI